MMVTEKVGKIFRDGMAQTIKDGVQNRSTAFLVNYTGLSALQLNELRKGLKGKKAEMYVSRNTIAKIALDELEYGSLAENLEGQTAFVWTDEDIAEISKALVNFSKDNENFVVKGGILDGEVIKESDVKRLSDLPSREVLLAQLLSTMQAPVSRLASALNAKTRDVLSILKQLSEKGGN